MEVIVITKETKDRIGIATKALPETARDKRDTDQEAAIIVFFQGL